MDLPRFAIIQYPGIVKNVDKAIVSLGGISKMSQDYYRDANLSLNYHVDNLFSKPTIARKRQSMFVIIRVRRKKHPDNTPSKSASAIQVQILGIAKTVYHFNLMFDYQYLPVRRIREKDDAESQTDATDVPSTSNSTNESPEFECITSKLYPQSLEDTIAWLTDEHEQQVADVGLFLPPYMFTKFFGSVPYIMARETERQHDWPKNMPMGARLRKQRLSYALMVHYKEENYPTEPDPRSQKKIDSVLREHPELGPAVAKAFEKRSLWTRCGMVYETNCGEPFLKDVLQGYAFYFMSGPWSRAWCKFGYDPRKDPESRFYQTVAYLLKNTRFTECLLRRKKKFVDELGKNKDYTDAIFKFKPDLVPVLGQTFYHLCDIDLPIVHEILAGPPQSECHPSHGWFTEKQLDSIRRAMKTEHQKLARETLQQEDNMSSGSEQDSN